MTSILNLAEFAEQFDWIDDVIRTEAYRLADELVARVIYFAC